MFEVFFFVWFLLNLVLNFLLVSVVLNVDFFFGEGLLVLVIFGLLGNFFIIFGGILGLKVLFRFFCF